MLSALNLYPKLLDGLRKLSDRERIAKCRNLCLTDLYFLLRYACKRADMEHPWVFDRCREVQEAPNGYLDLWAREHYKSTIITFGKTIQDVLGDPELTFGIFSHTRPIAKGFLRQIKREFEGNSLLLEWFPDVLWADPQKDAPKWSEDDGIILRRKSNPKESTVEAWGLVDGHPTSKHFKRLVYDDVVTKESVNTPDMIAKTTEALELSYSLGAMNGERRFIGTRYHFNDSYKTLKDRKTAIAREHPATEDGTMDSAPVLLSKERLAEKRRDMGIYTFGCQLLLNPKADEQQGFRREWIRHYRNAPNASRTNNYILVDAASEKKATSDYTSMFCVGLGSDKNYYILDMIRDRLSLTQRADRLFDWHRKYRPQQVRYEKYGMMADIEHIRDRQERETYRFEVIEVGGQVSKADRVRRLVPLFEQGRIYFPHTLHITDYEGVVRDLVRDFVEEEYAPFPVAIHDDMLDALARIAEPNLKVAWPTATEVAQVDVVASYDREAMEVAWLAT